jgi:hypothetical protein
MRKLEWTARLFLIANELGVEAPRGEAATLSRLIGETLTTLGLRVGTKPTEAAISGGYARVERGEPLPEWNIERVAGMIQDSIPDRITIMTEAVSPQAVSDRMGHRWELEQRKIHKKQERLAAEDAERERLLALRKLVDLTHIDTETLLDTIEYSIPQDYDLLDAYDSLSGWYRQHKIHGLSPKTLEGLARITEVDDELRRDRALLERRLGV